MHSLSSHRRRSSSPNGKVPGKGVQLADVVAALAGRRRYIRWCGRLGASNIVGASNHHFLVHSRFELFQEPSAKNGSRVELCEASYKTHGNDRRDGRAVIVGVLQDLHPSFGKRRSAQFLCRRKWQWDVLHMSCTHCELFISRAYQFYQTSICNASSPRS
jgi:hypothetical protein